MEKISFQTKILQDLKRKNPDLMAAYVCLALEPWPRALAHVPAKRRAGMISSMLKMGLIVKTPGGYSLNQTPSEGRQEPDTSPTASMQSVDSRPTADPQQVPDMSRATNRAAANTQQGGDKHPATEQQEGMKPTQRPARGFFSRPVPPEPEPKATPSRSIYNDMDPREPEASPCPRQPEQDPAGVEERALELARREWEGSPSLQAKCRNFQEYWLYSKKRHVQHAQNARE